MRRTAVIALAAFGFGLAAGPTLAAAGQEDFKVIQKAVKEGPAGPAAGEVKWFKVLITEAKSGQAQVRITLPVALIEAVLAMDGEKPLKVADGDCQIDLKAVWSALKKAGPMALVEIQDDGAVIKVWLE